MQSPIHLTIVMEAAEVEKLSDLNSQGVLLHVRFTEQQLQAVIASQELIGQEVHALSLETAVLMAALLQRRHAQVTTYFRGREYPSLLH